MSIFCYVNILLFFIGGCVEGVRRRGIAYHAIILLALTHTGMCIYNSGITCTCYSSSTRVIYLETYARLQVILQ